MQNIIKVDSGGNSHVHFVYFFLGCVQIVVPTVSFQRSLVLVILNVSLSISSHFYSDIKHSLSLPLIQMSASVDRDYSGMLSFRLFHALLVLSTILLLNVLFTSGLSTSIFFP